MNVSGVLGQLRAVLCQGPSYLVYYLLSWLYPTRILRFKAAASPYLATRLLLLRRSGVRIGKNSTIAFGTLVLGIARTPPALTLGDRAAVGPYVSFLTSSYPDNSRLRAHPELASCIQPLGPIVVEEDAWIGAGAILFPRVTIGRGAIVGAGAVVRADVPPYTVVAGVPARVIRTLNAPDGVAEAAASPPPSEGGSE